MDGASARAAQGLLAVGCAAWAAAFLRDAPVGVLVVVPVVFACGLLVAFRRPVLGAGVVGIGQALGLLLGAPTDNPSGMAAGLAALFLLGAHARVSVGIVVAAFFGLIILLTDVPTGRRVLGVALFAATWCLGAAVRRVTASTSSERRRALAAEERDVAAQAAALAHHEVQRHAAAAVGTSERALRRMRRLLDGTGAMSTRELEAIASGGRAAVDELRGVLSALRGSSESGTAAAPGATSDRRLARPDLGRPDLARAAVVVALVGAEHLLVAEHAGAALLLALAAGLGAAALIARVAPAAACLAAATPALVGSLTGAALPVSAAETGVVMAVVFAAAAAPRRTWPAIAVLLAALALVQRTSPSHAVVSVAAAGLALAAGIAWHRSIRERGAWQVRAQAHREALRERTARATAAERLRLAHDLHDVVSHSLAVAVLQAGAAARRLRDGADTTAAVRADITSAVEQALVDLTALAAVVEPDPQSSVTPGDALADLRTRAEVLGVDVTWHLDVGGDMSTARWPATVAGTVALVVREALTNVARHAPGSPVTVRIATGPDAFDLEVRNGCRAAGTGTAAGEPGTGHGLTGMAERIESIGGRVRTTRGGGTFRLMARIPLRTRAVLAPADPKVTRADPAQVAP